MIAHPDPLLATRRLEDAPAEDADLLVLLQLLLQLPQESANLSILLLFYHGRDVMTQETINIRFVLKSLHVVAAGVQGLHACGEVFDLLQAMFNGGWLRWSLLVG